MLAKQTYYLPVPWPRSIRFSTEYSAAQLSSSIRGGRPGYRLTATLRRTAVGGVFRIDRSRLT